MGHEARFLVEGCILLQEVADVEGEGKGNAQQKAGF
jgi:hypothetical protein